MRLGSFDSGTGPRAGVLTDEGIVDLAELLHLDGPLRDVADLLAWNDTPVPRVGDALEHAAGLRTWQPAEVRLCPPVLRPPSIRDHIAFEEHATKQFTRSVPDVWRRRPIHYYSNPSRLCGDRADVALPETERMDYELEIAAVIGREVSDVAADDALDSVLGFTIMNDWTARDLQMDEMAYGLGPSKGKDFATSLGPWIVTTDELFPALSTGTLDARCRVRVNGQTWGDGNAVHQYHSWGALLEHASQDSLLVPGDVIASGTVSGCSIGEALRKGFDAHYLIAGDVVELEVEHIGMLTNTIVESRRTTPARYRAAQLPEMPTPVATRPT